MSHAAPAHKRILLKLSGEALMGSDAFGINHATIVRMVQEIAEVLLYSSAEPSAVRAIQGRLGSDQAGALVEATLAAIACALVQRGVRQLIVAGGETSGACVQALGIAQLRIGAQIDPGVPWCHARSPLAPEGLHIALKSGNFGRSDFFRAAFARLPA